MGYVGFPGAGRCWRYASSIERSRSSMVVVARLSTCRRAQPGDRR